MWCHLEVFAWKVFPSKTKPSTSHSKACLLVHLVSTTTPKQWLLKTIKNLISSHVVSPSGGLEKSISVGIWETRKCVTVVMQSDLDWQPQHDLLDEAQRVLNSLTTLISKVYPHLFLIFPISHTSPPRKFSVPGKWSKVRWCNICYKFPLYH